MWINEIHAVKDHQKKLVVKMSWSINKFVNSVKGKDYNIIFSSFTAQNINVVVILTSWYYRGVLVHYRIPLTVTV